MECVKNCKLCDKFILSTAINYDSATNQVIVALPANAYGNCQKYCIVLAQSLPTAARINAQVVFSIGSNPTRYPFVNRDCTPIYVSQIRARRVYSTRVNTAVNTGVFKYIGNCCLPSNNITVNTAIPVSTSTTVTQNAKPIVENTSKK